MIEYKDLGDGVRMTFNLFEKRMIIKYKDRAIQEPIPFKKISVKEATGAFIDMGFFGIKDVYRNIIVDSHEVDKREVQIIIDSAKRTLIKDCLFDPLVNFENP